MVPPHLSETRMENYILPENIQPGQELDPYTVLRLRQAALHAERSDHGKPNNEDAPATKPATLRKARQ